MEPSHKNYLRYTRFVLVMVFMVIIAGGIVRMTQSGMGCPDWPRCFGRWIPPIHASQLPADFEKYLSKQDIDHSFNVYHTWIEYINRLLGALLGVFIFVHTIWSFRKFQRTKKDIAYLSLGLLLATGFQGWLGKEVVEANLAVVKVTIHMVVALLIAAIPIIIIHKVKRKEKIQDGLAKSYALATLIIILIQIVLGTQVREQIDVVSRSLNYGHRELWIERLDNIFFIHRSFSWLVALLCLLLHWRAKRHRGLRGISALMIVSVFLNIAIGITMNYLMLPIAQPAHLLLAAILFVCVFALFLQLKWRTRL